MRPSKGLGQNFLKDELALEMIVSAAMLQPTDHVLEIGPGLGSLTRHLARAVAKVTAVELDPDLFPALKGVLASYTNVTPVQGDILKLDPAGLMETSDYVVVANIPYYITSAVIRHLLESSPKPRRVVMTIQKEVAERVLAADGKMSLLALSVQVYGTPVIAAHIPAEAFYPVPKVDSSVLRIEIFPAPRHPQAKPDQILHIDQSRVFPETENPPKFTLGGVAAQSGPGGRIIEIRRHRSPPAGGDT